MDQRNVDAILIPTELLYALMKAEWTGERFCVEWL